MVVGTTIKLDAAEAIAAKFIVTNSESLSQPELYTCAIVDLDNLLLFTLTEMIIKKFDDLSCF